MHSGLRQSHTYSSSSFFLRPWIPHAFSLTPASLVSVWIRFVKISSQFTANRCWIQNRPYIKILKITQKKTQEHKNLFQNFAHILRQHYFFLYFVGENTWILWTKSIIIKKIRIGKLIFYLFQNITQQYGQKNGTALFEWGGRVCRSWTRTGPVSVY